VPPVADFKADRPSSRDPAPTNPRRRPGSRRTAGSRLPRPRRTG